MTRIRYRKMPPLTGTAEAAPHQTIELWKDDTAQKGKVATCPLCRILVRRNGLGCRDCPTFHRMPGNKACGDVPAFIQWRYGALEDKPKAAAAVVRWLEHTLVAGLKAREQ